MFKIYMQNYATQYTKSDQTFFRYMLTNGNKHLYIQKVGITSTNYHKHFNNSKSLHLVVQGEVIQLVAGQHLNSIRFKYV